MGQGLKQARRALELLQQMRTQIGEDRDGAVNPVNKNQAMKKRYFMVTLWHGHLGLDRQTTPEEEYKSAIRKWWDEMAIPEVQYRCGQMEVNDAGELHGQIAIKTSKSMRAVTLMRRHGGHWEPARNANAVLNYCQKTEGRIEFLGEDGSKPESRERTDGHGSAKRRAIRMLIEEGLSPEEIAKQDPEAYFTHHRAIDRLWERLNPGDESVGPWRR